MSRDDALPSDRLFSAPACRGRRHVELQGFETARTDDEALSRRHSGGGQALFAVPFARAAVHPGAVFRQFGRKLQAKRLAREVLHADPLRLPAAARGADGKPARRAQAQKTGVFPVLRNRREHFDLSVCAKPRAAEAPDGAPRGWSRCGRASETATRPNAPVLDIVPDSWEQYLVSNPAPFRGQDGKIYLMYKGASKLGTHSVGIAVADDFRGPYRRLSDQPYEAFQGCEDPCVWYEDGAYHALAPDHHHRYSDKEILYLSSADLKSWSADGAQPAISKRILFEDGTVRRMEATERPQIVLDDGGHSRFVCFATASHEGGVYHTWNMVVPLRP